MRGRLPASPNRVSPEMPTMIDQVFESFRKASESTLQMQQELFKQWTSQWSAVVPMAAAPTAATPTAAGTPAAWTEQAQTFQKRWLDTVTELMNKHRESLDAQYRAGIKAIEEIFKVADAKSPEDYRRLTEELWRRGFESIKSSTESQIRDFHAAMQKWIELMARPQL
jgi:hypothetical protein